MTTTALIVAAGSGQRSGQDLPKQYINLGPKTILRHSIEKFTNHPLIDQVVVVIGEGQAELFEKAVIGLEKNSVTYCIGGDTRQQSVLAGLKYLQEFSPYKILIHDAARPFVSAAIIENVVCALDTHKAVLPVLGLADTIKHIEGERCLGTVNRETLALAQTPQGFIFKEILGSHKRAAQEKDHNFTDDTSISEWDNMEVHTVAGSTENYKITTAEDIERAKMSITRPAPDIRCGDGFDVHKFGPGDCLTLCGIEIPHDQGLLGHSDADVALHALTDALLGAIASGDIGSHFPPSEPQWKDQSSDMFLAHACKLIADKKGSILNMDVTIICEQPKIGPLRDQMRRRIAEITCTDMSRISVKATTTEGLGFTGRKEGIAARASVSIYLGMIE